MSKDSVKRYELRTPPYWAGPPCLTESANGRLVSADDYDKLVQTNEANVDSLCDEIEKLEAENKKLREQLELQLSFRKFEGSDYMKLARNYTRLREALEFYADSGGLSADGGDTAREALKAPAAEETRD